MEELAGKLRENINDLCADYLFFKKTDIVEKVVPLTGDIQEFLALFLQGNVFGIEEEDYKVLSGYAAGVAADYVEALEQRDMVLMADTLEYGLVELLDIYLGPAEERDDGDL